jgi:hypothetical protein
MEKMEAEKNSFDPAVLSFIIQYACNFAKPGIEIMKYNFIGV